MPDRSLMTRDEVVADLERAVSDAGSQRRLARRRRVSQGRLSVALRGGSIPASILALVDVEPADLYRRVEVRS